ncbi:MAG TPA: ribosome biogenesis GTP-binding protein YihA/YsxC [Rickettsiales bacterium]|nr:ribosome biogenesis GTP-binding protein YihA/YsxC [Rickettsiales bacterium]
MSLFLKKCEFVMGGADLESLPATTWPEIAFAGRSNVGKSSIVNALTGRKTLVKVSNTPGRTQQINFFLLAEALMLVDLPGYGYAKAPKKDVARWTRLVKAYLSGRPNLRRVCLLIDSRHGIKDTDVEIMKELDKAAVNYQIILTKADKIKPAELEKVTEEAYAKIKRHPAAHPVIIQTSSEKGLGIEALREELEAFV